MTAAVVIRGDARHLPLPDASVDLVVTSPPYFGLRSYTDGGQHYDGQIGSEATPAGFLAALWECTREWIRVLKPEGSLFVNLGDKYVADNRGSGVDVKRGAAKYAPRGPAGYLGREMARHKSLLGLPWRYAIGCTDQLGLILRAEIIWSKPNGLPESVTDRVRRAHEQVFHLVKQPRYYSAVDEIREPQAEAWRSTGRVENRGRKSVDGGANNGFGLAGATPREYNPLGKLPGSVWDTEPEGWDDSGPVWWIPSAPLTVPAHLGIDHFAAFPPALVRPVVLGWSPPGVCTGCGQGRRPVVARQDERPANGWPPGYGASTRLLSGVPGLSRPSFAGTITGYACSCTITDPLSPATLSAGQADTAGLRVPPTRPAIVLDPFGGTGTVALVASVHGRTGVSVDLSHDYSRLARWRVRDPAERARALDVPKPPPVPDGQIDLFDMEVS